jgi:hypothetical protein
MKTVEKDHLIPTDTQQFIQSVFADSIDFGIDRFSSSYGEVRKNNQLSGEIQHQLIEIALGNQHVSTLSAESMSNIQSVLDKYRAADKTRVERKRELTEVFSAPMWAIMYDKTDSFCIGKLNLTPKWGSDDTTTTSSVAIGIAEPFKRVADVTDVPELIPTMTMLKVAVQQSEAVRDKTFVGESQFFPADFETVVPELRVIGLKSGSRWERRALLSPKILLVAA